MLHIRQKEVNSVLVIIVILIIPVLFAIVSTMDNNDAVEQDKDYCEMVKAGHWPNYNKDINCEDK